MVNSLLFSLFLVASCAAAADGIRAEAPKLTKAQKRQQKAMQKEMAVSSHFINNLFAQARFSVVCC